LRRPATTAGMSTAVVGELGGADASVVMGVLPDPRNTHIRTKSFIAPSFCSW
jgi:hypothetical protein